MTPLTKIKKVPSKSLLLLLLTASSLLLWNLLSYYLDGNLEYAHFFFEEIYIVILVTLFGFLLLTSSSLINTAGTTRYYREMFEENPAEEEHEDERRRIINNTPNLCLWLLSLFLFSVSLWISTLLAIQQENNTHFYIFAFLCILLMISLIAATVFQMYVTAGLKERSAESHKNKTGS